MLTVPLAAAAQSVKPDVNGGGGGGGTWVAPVLSVSSSGSPSAYGSSVTFTGSLIPASCAPNAIATLYDDGTAIGSSTWSSNGSIGTATFTTSSMAIGTYSITVGFGGNQVGTTDCRPETSPPSTQVVDPATSIAYPAYKVVSIIYSTPGNKSQSNYGQSTTDGSRTTIGSNLAIGSSEQYTSGGNFLGFGGTLSVTFGVSETTGNSSEVTDTFTQGAGVGSLSTLNPINHGQDMFIVWLNPAIAITQTGPATFSYSMGTQSEADGQPQPVDLVEVYAQDMLGTNGQTTVPVGVLMPQPDPSDSNNFLPGLAAICTNNSLYQQELAWDLANPSLPQGQYCNQGNQCGCQPTDFNGPNGVLANGQSAILALDPLLGFARTDNPMGANTSNLQDCGMNSDMSLTTPSQSADCRYLAVPNAAGSSTQLTEKLQGPSSPGGDMPINSATLDDSTMNVQTQTKSVSVSVAYSWKVEYNIGYLAGGNSWKWTESESSGNINGYSNSMGYTMETSTVDCYEPEIRVYYDTVFHTFVYQEGQGSNTCP